MISLLTLWLKSPRLGGLIDRPSPMDELTHRGRNFP